MSYLNNKTKRLLKSELVKRGVSNSELAFLLSGVGIEETKSSIDSKISRGTFSATFFIQSLMVIGCSKIELDVLGGDYDIAAEPGGVYQIQENEN